MRLTVVDQKLPAGLEDDGLEFYVFQNEVRCLYKGRKYRFDEFPSEVLQIVEDFMMSKPEVIESLHHWGIINADDMIRQFIFCHFGGFDMAPDIDSTGRIFQADYFDCGRRGKCPYEGKLCGAIKVENGYLTKQEIKILQLIAQGRLNKEIAAELGIEESTVSTHNQNIQIKTGCNRKPELAVLARDKNLL